MALLTDKPVATIGVGGSLASAAVAFAVGRGWVPADLAPALSGVLSAVLYGLIHVLVSPVAKVRAVLAAEGHLTDADFGRLEALVSDVLVTVAKPKAQATVVTVAPPSMGAGA